MSQGSVDAGGEGGSMARNRPAIGVIANETNTLDVLQTILRAQQHDYSVLVTYQGTNPLPAEYGSHRGVEVVPPESPHSDSSALSRSLVRTARDRGFPGLVFHRNADEPIDFGRSAALLSESDRYTTEAITDPFVVDSDGSDDREGGILVAIPAYNEAGTIASVVSEARKHADSVIVVDDGSQDETTRRADEAGALVIRHDRNRGYGAALRTAFREARVRNAAHLVVLDGDGQHDSADISKFVSVQRETGVDIVTGNRFGDEASSEVPLYRRFGLEVINRLTHLSMSILRSDFDIRDTQSGFRAYNRRAIRTLATDDTLGDGMSASLGILFHAQRHGYELAEVDTTIEYEVEQASSHNPLRHGYILVGAVLQTIEHERPITILGVPGTFSTFVGVGFGYWALSNYLQTDIFPVGLALTAVFFVFIGFLACFAAIILHSLNGYFATRPDPFGDSARLDRSSRDQY